MVCGTRGGGTLNQLASLSTDNDWRESCARFCQVTATHGIICKMNNSLPSQKTKAKLVPICHKKGFSFPIYSRSVGSLSLTCNMFVVCIGSKWKIRKLGLLFIYIKSRNDTLSYGLCGSQLWRLSRPTMFTPSRHGRLWQRSIFAKRIGLPVYRKKFACRPSVNASLLPRDYIHTLLAHS